MAKNNLPTQVIEAVPAPAVTELVTSLIELRNLGKPKTDAEFQQRCDQYFNYCSHSSLRPGIEGLSLSLGIDRTTLWRWCAGIGCSRERAEMARAARQMTIAYLEAAEMAGRINPVSAIFAKKNWAGYADSIRVEDVRPDTTQATLSPDEIMKRIEKDIPIDTALQIEEQERV